MEHAGTVAFPSHVIENKENPNVLGCQSQLVIGLPVT